MGASAIQPALARAREAGLTHLNLDGTVVRTDRVSTPGPNGADLWWSGKHKHRGDQLRAQLDSIGMKYGMFFEQDKYA